MSEKICDRDGWIGQHIDRMTDWASEWMSEELDNRMNNCLSLS